MHDSKLCCYECDCLRLQQNLGKHEIRQSNGTAAIEGYIEVLL